MIERIINFVLKVPSLIWLILVTGVVIILGIIVVSKVVTQVGTALDEVNADYEERARVYQERVEQVKRDCDLRQQVMSPSSTIYRYRCSGGVDFEFEEAL